MSLETIPDDDRVHVILEQSGDPRSSSSSSQTKIDAAITDQNKHDSILTSNGAVPGAKHDRESKPSKLNRVKSVGSKAKARTKRLFRISGNGEQRNGHNDVRSGGQDSEAEETDPYQALDEDAAFNPSKLLGSQRVTVGSTADKLAGTLYTAAKSIVHPQDALKKKATAKVAVSDRPYLSQQNDMDYLQAHEALLRAQSSNGDPDEEDDIEEKQAEVDAVESARESRKVAWLTSRHVQRVRVVPKRDVLPPSAEDYYYRKPGASKDSFDWSAYLQARNRNSLKNFAINRMGNVDTADPPPFDRNVCLKYVERLLIASAPWQTWVASMRKLYRWENPRETRKWLYIWLFIWYMDYCVTFVLCYMAYIVLENHFRPVKAETLRDSYQRASNKEGTAFKFNEMISRHGDRKWLDPLLEELGPVLQIQLADTADFLEVLYNFYEWKTPKKTWATLFWFACAISIGVLTDTGFSVKIIWMFCLLSFFLGRPIASKHPRYRHTVNALKWIFWDIPTNAEWSFMYLREKAQETRAQLIAQQVEKTQAEESAAPPAQIYVGSLDTSPPLQTGPTDKPDASEDSDGDSWHSADSSTSILGGLDLLSFHCRQGLTSGRLIIFSSGLRFVRSAPRVSMRKEVWRHEWHELAEIRKVKDGTIAKIVQKEGLELELVEGDCIRVDGMKARDKAFNCIVGFSGMQWQVLQPAATGGLRRDEPSLETEVGRSLEEDTRDGSKSLF